MSLQTIQRRHPWIMAPTQWLSHILTPERWPFLPHALASGITRVIAFDTTGIGRAVRQLSPFDRIREAVLPRSSLLRSLDWQARKLFWTAVWCTLVASQGWPRRAPRLRRERNIRLLSAPETYDDFQSPTLVVPAGVPYAEKSLINMVTVQVVHLLQDIYPLVRTHQAPGVADPQERFDRAYTFPYRLVRDPPRWHPDLVAASERRNLLGALAAGGPFAKLLQRAGAQSPEYVIDLQHFANYEVHDGLCRLGSRIRYTAPDGHLAVTGVEYEGETITPTAPGGTSPSASRWPG